MQNALTFNSINFTPVTIGNTIWLSSPQIGDALGYAKGRISIDKIFRSNADEFTPTMTQLVEMDTAGGKQMVRVFSLRGTHLLAMFARTQIAKQFRKWVLDVLDKETGSYTAPERKTKQVLIGKLTADQQDAIKALVNSRIDSVPKEKQRGTAMKLWGAINRKFGTKTYKDIDPSEFVNVLSLVSRLPLEGELMPRNETPAIPEGMVLVRKDLLEETNNMIHMINERFALVEKAENDIQHAFNLLSVITSGHMKQASDAIREARYRLIDPIKHAKSYTGLMLN